VEIKCQLDATEVFIADLTAWSTCFGHHYAHHQELKSFIQWLLPVVFRAVVFKLLFCCGAEGYVSGLQDFAKQPPANRTHINDDAHSKPHQIYAYWDFSRLVWCGVANCWLRNLPMFCSLCMVASRWRRFSLSWVANRPAIPTSMSWTFQTTSHWYVPVHSLLWLRKINIYLPWGMKWRCVKVNSQS